jgi:hypothetical protein
MQRDGAHFVGIVQLPHSSRDLHFIGPSRSEQKVSQVQIAPQKGRIGDSRMCEHTDHLPENPLYILSNFLCLQESGQISYILRSPHLPIGGANTGTSQRQCCRRLLTAAKTHCRWQMETIISMHIESQHARMPTRTAPSGFDMSAFLMPVTDSRLGRSTPRPEKLAGGRFGHRVGNAPGIIMAVKVCDLIFDGLSSFLGCYCRR